MKIVSRKYFDKRFQKLQKNIQFKIIQVLELFASYPFDERLRNHGLTGKYKGLRSIDVTGDVRIIYDPVSADEALLVDIGTHSQLYK